MDHNQSPGSHHPLSKRTRSELESQSSSSYVHPTTSGVGQTPPSFFGNVPIPEHQQYTPSPYDHYAQLLQSQGPFPSPQQRPVFTVPSPQMGQTPFFSPQQLPYTPLQYQGQFQPPPQQTPQHHQPSPTPPPQDDPNLLNPDPTDSWMTPEEMSTSRRTSSVWKDFLLNKNKRNPKAKCKHCGGILTAGSAAGTGHLNRHIKSCAVRNVDPSQPSMSQFVQRPNPDFQYSYDDDRLNLSRMVIQSEQSFLWAEGRPFNRYVSSVQPEHKTTGRKTVRSDALKQFRERKVMLQHELDALRAKINLTSDCWDSRGDLHYLCVTAHWVDDDWMLQKRIIGFQPMEYPHTGINISNIIMQCIQEYGIRDKILTITFDNATSNNVAVRYMRNQLGDQMLEGRLLHVRCACHILNLCVRDGQQGLTYYHEIFKSIVRTLNSSKARRQEFRNHCHHMRVKYKRIPMECDTRWNSTYEMLSVCLEYKDVLTPFWNEGYASRSESTPRLTDSVWINMEMYVDLLNTFYNATKLFSCVYTPVASSFMMNLFLVGQVFKRYRGQEDYNSFLPEMEEKFMKYWEEIPLIYMFACILDPRIKFDCMILFATRYFDDMNIPFTENDLKTDIYNKFLSFYDIYESRYGRSARPMPQMRQNVEGSSSSSRGRSSFSATNLFASAFSALEQVNYTAQPSSDIGEFQMYLKFDFVKGMAPEESANLDILQWWRAQRRQFPILAAMARDVFSVQVSSVASERAFSASGRVLNEKRTRMNSETLEMCVCYKDWLDADDRKQDNAQFDMDSDDSGYATSTHSIPPEDEQTTED